MSDSLRDQLLGLGFKPAPKPDKPARGDGGRPGKPRDDRARHGKGASGARADGKAKPGKPAPRGDIDLGRAYAIRAQREKDERIEAERRRQEEARQRREAKAKLAALLKDKALNDPAAELVRHFEYGGKIKRIYVNAAQLAALNAGELGVVQLDGRYLLVDAAVLAEAEAVFAPAVALKGPPGPGSGSGVDPSTPADADPYADPRYQVPDDLVW